MNFHLQEVSVHNLGICYGALGIALVPVVPVFIFFSHAEKNAFVAVERPNPWLTLKDCDGH